MKICTSEQEYISAIAEAAQKACKRYGYLPSVLIAQACVENGYGIPDYWDNPQIALLIKYNNMVGIKSSLLNSSWTDIGLSVWPGESLTKQTPEVYGGKPVTITDNFRKYDSVEQSFVDYLLFMTYASNDGPGGKPKYGKTVLNMRDPESLITAVNVRGYTTGTTYPGSVMKIVKKHNLTKYDDLSKIEPTDMIPPAIKGRKIIPIGEWNIKKSPEYNQQVPSRGNEKKYIAVHYLGVDGQNNGLWDDGKGAHYVVYWDGTIYKVCDHDAITWQVGTSNGAYVQKHPYARNSNCIGIEMCCHNTDGYCPETPTGEKHWYFTESTQRAAAWLVRKLMKDLNLDISHVLRHFDVVNKNCPAPYVYNNKYKGSWTWDEFLNAVKTGYCPDGSGTPAEPEKWYRVRKAWTDEASQLGAYKVLDNSKSNCPKGYAVYDWTGKEVYRPKETAADKFLASNKNVCDTARKENWSYGDSHTLPPCEDKTISCDRMPARALWDLGFTDQRMGGEVCTTLPTWLTEHGWKFTTNMDAIKAGAVVAVRKKDHSYIDHIFVVESYNPKTGYCNKYDCGSKARIDSSQPFKGVKLMEWSDRVFVGAWNVPDDFENDSVPIPPADIDEDSISGTTWNGVDYKPVYAYTYYRKKYEDLRKVFGNDKEAYFLHFIQYGMNECRQAKAIFNVKKYRERYADLRKEFGDKWPEYYKHYCLYGKKEGRKAT